MSSCETEAGVLCETGVVSCKTDVCCRVKQTGVSSCETDRCVIV